MDVPEMAARILTRGVLVGIVVAATTITATYILTRPAPDHTQEIAERMRHVGDASVKFGQFLWGETAQFKSQCSGALNYTDYTIRCTLLAEGKPPVSVSCSWFTPDSGCWLTESHK